MRSEEYGTWWIIVKVLAFTLSEKEICCSLEKIVSMPLVFCCINITWPEFGNSVDIRERILIILCWEGDRKESRWESQGKWQVVQKVGGDPTIKMKE